MMTDFFRPTGAGHLLFAWKESILHPAYGPVLEGDVDDEKRNAPSWQLKLPVPVSGAVATLRTLRVLFYQPSRFAVHCMLDLVLLITYLTLFVGKLW